MKWGERDGSVEKLDEAIVCFQRALEAWPREHVPLDWATAQNNLGIGLMALSKHENETAHVEAAVAAFLAALEERTQDRVPDDYVTTQNNLNAALSRLGR